MRYDYEVIHEMDYDGGIGSLMGVLIEGHLELDDVEIFLADEMGEIFYDDAPLRGFDIDHVYWRSEPYIDEYGNKVDGSHVYVYDADASKGGHPATKLEVETTWEKRCFRHPFEVAASGVHKATVVEDQVHFADEFGYIYLCARCYDRYRKRFDAAIKRELARVEGGAS